MNEALDNLIDAWHGPLVGLFSAWGASTADSSDLAQDVFVEAWMGRDRCEFGLEEVEAVGPWLRGIGRNLWRAHLRKRSREHPLEAVENEPASPEARVKDTRLEGLHAAIEDLPEAQREAVWVRYIEEQPAAAAAALLGVNENTLASRLWRARVSLKEQLSTEVAGKGLSGQEQNLGDQQ